MRSSSSWLRRSSASAAASSVTSCSKPTMRIWLPSPSRCTKPRPRTTRTSPSGRMMRRRCSKLPVSLTASKMRRDSSKSSGWVSAPQACERGLEAVGVDAVDRVELLGPAQLVGHAVDLPAADRAQLGGAREQRLGAAQLVLDAQLGGHVARDATDPGDPSVRADDRELDRAEDDVAAVRVAAPSRARPAASRRRRRWRRSRARAPPARAGARRRPSGRSSRRPSVAAARGSRACSGRARSLTKMIDGDASRIAWSCAALSSRAARA